MPLNCRACNTCLVPIGHHDPEYELSYLQANPSEPWYGHYLCKKCYFKSDVRSYAHLREDNPDYVDMYGRRMCANCDWSPIRGTDLCDLCGQYLKEFKSRRDAVPAEVLLGWCVNCGSTGNDAPLCQICTHVYHGFLRRTAVKHQMVSLADRGWVVELSQILEDLPQIDVNQSVASLFHS